MIKKLEKWLRKIISDEVKKLASKVVTAVDRLTTTVDRLITTVDRLITTLDTNKDNFATLVSHTDFLAKAKAQELARQGHKVTK